MDPHQKYIIKSTTPNSSGEYLVSTNSSSLPRSHNNFTISSNENNSYSSLSNHQSPSQRSQVSHHHHHHVQDGSNAGGVEYIANHHHVEHQKEKKSRRHYHGHSCNPCMGHFISKRDKSVEKDNKEEAALDAYDLASPCCDPNCVPVKRRSRHHKEHHHKHKHREKDKERPPRPRSQSHASPQMQTAHVHYEPSGKHVSQRVIDVVTNVINQFVVAFFQDHRANNHYDLSSQLASHCSLRSCNSNEFCQQPSMEGTTYSTSLSSDTLWDPKSEPAQSCNHQSFKSLQRPTSVYHQPSTSSHSYVHRYVHPSQVQPIQSSITTTHAYAIQPQQYTSKPKSWDNLALKNCGGYAYSYVVSNPNKHPVTPNGRTQVHQPQQQQPPPLPRKSGHAPYGRYSAFADVENYVPAPPGYLQEATITKTTIITTKSTENLISNGQYGLDGSCDCIAQPSPKLTKAIIAPNCVACNPGAAYYYSNLARNNSTRCAIPTKTEITRL